MSPAGGHPRPSTAGADVVLAQTRQMIAERPCATMDVAVTMAEAAYRAVLGKRIEIESVVGVDIASGGSTDHYSQPGKPFVVLVKDTEDKMLRRDMDTHVDPIWRVDVVDGRGIIAADGSEWHYVHGASYELTSPRPIPARARRR